MEVFMNRASALIVLLVLATAGAGAAVAGLRTEVVEYRVGDDTFSGYLAWDDASAARRPGVLVVHEWWGHNPYARKRAEMLAGLGYTAFALDMYGSGKLADHPDDAKAFMTAVTSDMPAAEARFGKALELLRGQDTVDAQRIAAIGYCFGGGMVLHMARAGMDLDGVASFHGSLGTKTPAQPGRVKASVLVLNGAADPFVPPEQVQAFEQEMETAGVDFTLVNYPGVKHSFTNPDADSFGKQFDMPLAYDAKADADSWERLQVFLKTIFQ
jgi:dienelactone hydrolase